jgi:serine/threonine protein kinase
VISGRYSLDREIGRGATGTVWLGRDEVLGRRVALKRIGLLPGSDRTDLARAEREARLSARLEHPHVLGVYDAAADDRTDTRWLVMEYVDGADLGRLVRERGPLAPDQAAPLLAQAAGALAAAHAAGIVHRDVKPSNILVDRSGQVKITDFGIARLVSDATLTQTGFVLGSPAYLAPEVAAGARADEAADVWSLGATLFHVLTGRPPYDIGENVVGGLYRIVHEEPPRPPDAGWLAPLLEATMVRDPAHRWSMSQVHAYLASGGDVAAPATSTGTQEIAPAPAPVHTRSRVPLAIVATVSVALVVVLALVGAVVLHDRGGGHGAAARSGGASATHTATKATGPTAAGMESFIRRYVSTVADDPSKSWQMLTPKFQQESGGFVKYSRFWGPATDGRVLSISTDPKTLTVSYQVHFDDFHNGPGPTVLDLTYSHGHYLIDGEHSHGFVPAG